MKRKGLTKKQQRELKKAKNAFLMAGHIYRNTPGWKRCEEGEHIPSICVKCGSIVPTREDEERMRIEGVRALPDDLDLLGMDGVITE